jgi:hypothetical protein
MRVMVIVKASADSEAGRLPGRDFLAEMGRYNEELVKAGVMLAGDGLEASAKGKRVSFEHGKVRVLDGPFTETKELIAGYWIWQVKSIDEAVEWARRSPFANGAAAVEIRRVLEAADFGAELTPELCTAEGKLREQLGGR